VAGTCVPRPAQCTNQQQLACGCDGVTYFNDCLREQVGISSSTAGECGALGKSCGGIASIPCPTKGAICAFLLSNSAQCGIMDPMGSCWVIPSQCPGIVIGGDYRPCLGAIACQPLCNAIQKGGPYFHDSSCPQ
jgi:hypothetical protein